MGSLPLGFTKIAKPISCAGPNLPDQPQDKSCVLVTNIPLEINDRHLSLTASVKRTRNKPHLPHPLNHTHAQDSTVGSGPSRRQNLPRPGVQSVDFRA